MFLCLSQRLYDTIGNICRRKGELVIPQHAASSRILCVLQLAVEAWRHVVSVVVLPSQCSHSTPTQLLPLFFQQGPAAAPFHFDCLSCCPRVFECGCCQDQQMLRRWYPAPWHLWCSRKKNCTRSTQWAVTKLLWQVLAALCVLWLQEER